MSVMYTTMMQLSCDKKGCIGIETYRAVHGRTDADAFYQKANEFFLNSGWSIYKRKNYCPGCTQDIVKRLNKK